MQENERRILELEATVLRQEEEKFMMREDLDWQRHENACLRSDNRALKACLQDNGLPWTTRTGSALCRLLPTPTGGD